MGKHNGKARRTGMKVGSSLTNRASARSKEHKQDGRHTTDFAEQGPNMQSIIERNDLDEFLAMAELQGREFHGERGTAEVIVVHDSVAALDSERAAEERREVEARNMHKLRIPRRPAWTHDTTPEELEDMEKAMFLDWRRDLARLEETERLCLTPFEKNLEVWRQLWRVLERSDCVVQVVDARDPLRYYSEDLAAYSRELSPTKRNFVLLNKADLLSEACRVEWARWFGAAGVPFAFWSAREAAEADKEARQMAKLGGSHPAAADSSGDDDGGPTRRLEDFASECCCAGSDAGETSSASIPDRRLMVGLVGYPNVGKSSTINALYGSKKTSVAATPGKTKHFQTLNLDGCQISLCDCPGLVFPRFAASKAEMVAAGVVPIDRLTDIAPPVSIVVSRAGRQQLSRVYGMSLPPPADHEDPNRPPTAAEAITALAITRGWIAGSGLPDGTRAGRHLLKDYVDGKLVYMEWPPDADEAIIRHTPEFGPRAGGGENHDAAGDTECREESSGDASSSSRNACRVKDRDVELLRDMGISSADSKQRRPEYKFHKKAARSKGTRGQNKESDGGVSYGKKGGLVRVGGY
eukprot:CAMPEP_0177589582 /NCGR_PEP_ID=MMETSP0419_2-20121207/6894_1 /TAXON_ID=582737 /ORGANISM="Tetraselmis sp., Strain GSL018" /LENGTH=580 /DNA_ID=CAMNT_0019079973 /DNA_START=127 /DNA_END=1869 /DNA_ORIENTATION=-